MIRSSKVSKPLFQSSDWNFTTLGRVYDAVEEIAIQDLGLNVYPNQVEIISSEQMLDAYSSIGMPLMYRHWTFGKRFLQEEYLYRKGHASLAYELVINSKPCISYLMEENTMAMQTLVTAHAAFGHNHFFKNNQLFQQWTDAGSILDYMDFARTFIARCEERHGVRKVELILDAAHALMEQGVFRYRRPTRLSSTKGRDRERERAEYKAQTYNDLWRTLPGSPVEEVVETADEKKAFMASPEENLLYFLEKNSPVLETWQREILRIVRFIAQYFYPQRQTKVMNEGCATYTHYTIMNTLFDRGLLTEGALLEMLQSHSNVVFQPSFDDPRYNGLNPYALGFAMMQDIQRICEEPTTEDEEWFPDIAGKGNSREVLLDAWANHRDESFVRQYLSPTLIRKMRLFAVTDEAKDSYYEVSGIHDERGYDTVRAALAHSFDIAATQPDIQVVDCNLLGDRCLYLRHRIHNGILLAEESRNATMRHIQTLWGYEVRLSGVDADDGKELYSRSTKDAE